MAKIFIKTFGCAHNISDSEIMAGVLTKAGHIIVKKREDGDIVLINSCTVKDPSEKRFLNEIEKTKKPIILAGCVPQSDLKRFQNYSVVGVREITNVGKVVESLLKGEKTQYVSLEKNPSLMIEKKRVNPFVEILPISTGCLGSCTFCKTKYARGNIKSYPIGEIIERIKLALREGVCEVWLTGEDLGAYGKDCGENLLNLLNEIKKIDSKNNYLKIRLGMINPTFAKEYIEGLIEVYKDPKFYKFFHIPVQSGSNKVLRDMRRDYLIEDFEDIVKKIRKNITNITISTDVIVGYPTETEEDFEKTISLIKKYRFAIINISKFYPRKGTYAARLKQLPTNVIKKRCEKIVSLYNSYNLNKRLKGKTIKAYFFKKERGNFIGKTDNYVEVVVKSKRNILGTAQNIKVEDTKKFYISGKIVEK